MEQREKLIKLMLNNPRADGCYGIMCDADCKYFESDHCYTEMLADYLLANGVVVLPCRCCECEYYDRGMDSCGRQVCMRTHFNGFCDFGERKGCCPLGGDTENDCCGCSYSGEYHFNGKDCVKREENE